MLRLAYLASLYLWYDFRIWIKIKRQKSKGEETLVGVGNSTGQRTQVDDADTSAQALQASVVPPADLVKRQRAGKGQYRTSGSPSRLVKAKGKDTLPHTACPPSGREEGTESGTPCTGICQQGGDLRDLRRALKRSAIWEKMTPLTVLTSVVSDLDLFADWYFLKEGLEGENELVSDVAFVLTVVGTVMYVLLTLEFHPVSEAWTCCRRGRSLSPLQHVPLGWQLLLNVVVEDIPQLIITCVTSPTSLAGVLNIATAGFALLAKMAEAFATRNDLPMSSQLRMIETDPGVVQHLLKARHKAEQLAANAASLAVLVNKFRTENAAMSRDQESERHSKRLATTAFQVMQTDPNFLSGELGYIREKLEVSRLDLARFGLKGSIPSSLGDLAQLTELDLRGNSLGGVIPEKFGSLSALITLNLDHNKLVGYIPPELGGLRELRELNLQDNQLTGTIPTALGSMSKLQRLYLDHNKLGGTIPRELGALRGLRVLYLGGNHITGEIPSELGALAELQQLNLGGNQLRGAEDEERLGRLFPNCEMSVSSWTNEWG